jgi:hypothetical protein
MKKNRKIDEQKKMERRLRKRKRSKKRFPEKIQQEPEAITFHFHDEVTNECLLSITVHKIDEDPHFPLSDDETSGIIDLN